VSDYYDILGVDKTADEKTIKKAYRKKAQQHHPDVGGADGDFALVATAYAVLSDSTQRAYYDKHGKPPEKEVPLEAKARDTIRQAVSECIRGAVTSDDVSSTDIAQRVREALYRTRDTVNQRINQMRKYIDKLGEVSKRFSPITGSDDDIARACVEQQIGLFETDIKAAQDDMKVLDAAIELWKAYSYKTDRVIAQYTVTMKGTASPFGNLFTGGI
jgi:curved DNA-binding protein CbpA